MWIRSSFVFALVLFTIAAAEDASAQSRSGMSAFGSGMSGFGSSGFGSSFGSSGFGASGFGSSGFGSSFGSSGFGSSGFGANMGGNQAFIGRDATDMQAVFTQLRRSLNSMNRQAARSNLPQRPVTTRNPAQPIRTEVQVAFDVSQPASDAVAKTLQLRLAKIMGDHQMTVPTVSVQNGTAVLSGVAKSDSERRVIGSLVSLEPGVRSVRNEMTVAGEPTAGTTSPSGS